MLHDIDEVMKKIMAMQDLALLAHKIKYSSPDGYDEKNYQHVIDNIQQLAGDIYNDRQEPSVQS